jgi:hypothetical protein
MRSYGVVRQQGGFAQTQHVASRMRALRELKKSQPETISRAKTNKTGLGISAKSRLTVGERHAALSACVHEALMDDHPMDRQQWGMSDTCQQF